MKNLKIGARLGLAFAIVLVLLLIMAATALARMQAAGDLTYRLVNTSMKNQYTVSEWRKLVEVNDAMIGTVFHAQDAGVVARLEPRLRANLRQADALQAEVDAKLLDQKVRGYLDRAKDSRGAYDAAREAVLQARLSGDLVALDQAYRTRFVPQAQAFEAALEEFATRQSTATAGVGTTILASYRETRFILIALAIVAVLLGACCAWFITRSITHPLRRAVEVPERVASGDLGSRITVGGGDETGQLMDALGRMNGSLAGIVGQVRDGSAAIAQASGEIASGNQDLSARTEQQASSLEETAALMEELTSTVRQNTDHARRANSLQPTPPWWPARAAIWRAR